ncbi:MAG: adenylate/guanylate cyclase protein, partial [Dehalococcoidia bacterium]|nr:adenylate/guanylate cyclase protein [Dehalococcoidia bacterium]
HPDDHQQRAVEAGLQILEGVATLGGDNPLAVGAGIASGEVFVGNVGPEGSDVRDFTVIGDIVNVAARLQGEAAPGELLVTEETYAWVSRRYPDAPKRELQLRGRSQPVTARVLTPSS